MSDLGISKPSFDQYGIIPYVAPEVLRGGWTTKASNIYSFGMIMWELMTNRRPFWDQSHDTNLIIKIIDGFRPPVTTNAPEGCVELMKECWHSNPEKRPRICEIYKRVYDIWSKEYNNKTKIIKSSDIGLVTTDTTDNPGAIYKNRYLGDMIEAASSTKSLKDKRKYEENYFNDNVEDNNNDEDKIIKKIKI